jgi:hypothetical protein
VPTSPLVPEQLRRGPFRTVEAQAAGLTRAHLRSTAWRRLYRGIFVHAELPLTLDVRLEALRLAAPTGAVLAGVSAAWVHGVLDPHPARPAPLHVARRHSTSAPRIPGVRGSRLSLDELDVVEVNGFLVTSPARTCLDLTRLGSIVDAVVAVDAFLSADLVIQDELWRFCSERRRWPNIDRLREAVLLGSDRVRSPAESRLRMLLVLDGLPEPLVNAPVHDERGKLMGIPDLLYLKPLLGIEYDGSYHNDPKVHQVDLIRENRLLTHGLPLLRYSKEDMRTRAEQIPHEVRAALKRLQ